MGCFAPSPVQTQLRTDPYKGRAASELACSARIKRRDSILEVMSADRGKEAVPPMPRWVKLLGIAALLVIVVVVILHLTGNGFGSHGLPH